MNHEASRQLRRTQRSPAFVLRLFAITAVLALLAQWPPVGEALGLRPADIVRALGALLGVNLLAFAAYHRLGDQSRAYRLAALVEACTLLGGIMWLVYRGGRGDGFMWLLYFAAATINSGVTEYRRALTLLYGAFPLMLAVAFAVLRGDWAASCLSLTCGALGLFVFETRMKSNVLLAQARAQRERALEQLAELKVRDERQRIARDLHDGLGADLAAMAWRAQRLESELVEANQDVAGGLGSITERATQGIDELRTVVWALRSPTRRWPELVEYLQQRLAELCARKVRLTIESGPDGCDEALSGETATHVIRITQEAVRNALRHASPTHIAVSLTFGATIRLSVEDDGGGLPDGVLETSRGGLANLRARALECGGTFTPESVGGWTRLSFELTNAEVRRAG